MAKLGKKLYSDEELMLIKKIPLPLVFYKIYGKDNVRNLHFGRYSVVTKDGEVFEVLYDKGDGSWKIKNLDEDASEVRSGGNAIDWLVHFEKMSFREACIELAGQSVDMNKSNDEGEPKDSDNMARRILQLYGTYDQPDIATDEFKIPAKYPDWRNVSYLLLTKHIPYDVTEYFIRHRMLYEDAIFHNAIFVGYDAEGGISYVYKYASDYEYPLRNSDLDQPFRLTNKVRDSVHFFKTPIELLQYATLLKYCRYEFRLENLVVADSERVCFDFLKEHPDIHKVHMHFASDFDFYKISSVFEVFDHSKENIEAELLAAESKAKITELTVPENAFAGDPQDQDPGDIPDADAQ